RGRRLQRRPPAGGPRTTGSSAVTFIEEKPLPGTAAAGAFLCADRAGCRARWPRDGAGMNAVLTRRREQDSIQLNTCLMILGWRYDPGECQGDAGLLRRL